MLPTAGRSGASRRLQLHCDVEQAMNEPEAEPVSGLGPESGPDSGPDSESESDLGFSHHSFD